MRVLESDTGCRVRSILYGVSTAIIALESAVGGVWDVLRTDYVRDVLERELGYPWYVAAILGVWKIPGALILVAPRFPRLKEWVYAGAVFVYTGAAASYFFVGNVGTGIGPLGFAAITMISWALRPVSRRHPAPSSAADPPPGVPPRSTATTIAFWAVSLSFTGALLSGGVADLVHRPETVGGMVALGYPGYFLYVLGFWKVPAPVAILLPRFTRLKEWAYAGVDVGGGEVDPRRPSPITRTRSGAPTREAPSARWKRSSTRPDGEPWRRGSSGGFAQPVELRDVRLDVRDHPFTARQRCRAWQMTRAHVGLGGILTR
ncbi:DoxX family protein [Actinosynnema sp. NPDC051121]